MRQPAPAARIVVTCAGLALLLAGCTGSGTWARSRAADAADVLPLSFGWGWGISASAQATPFLNLGLAASPVVSARWGWDDRSYNGVWHEYEATFPWTIWLDEIGGVPPRPFGANEGRPFGNGVTVVYRWQATKDGPGGEAYDSAHWQPVLRVWGRHPPTVRETGGALLIPEYRRSVNWLDLRLEQGDEEPLALLGTPARATLWEARRDGPDLPRPWDLFEVDVFAGFIGIRLGVRPLEFCDFLVGLVGLDPAGDDIHATTSNPPVPSPPLPLPVAAPPALPPEPGPEAEPEAGTGDPIDDAAAEPVTEPDAEPGSQP